MTAGSWREGMEQPYLVCDCSWMDWLMLRVRANMVRMISFIVESNAAVKEDQSSAQLNSRLFSNVRDSLKMEMFCNFGMCEIENKLQQAQKADVGSAIYLAIVFILSKKYRYARCSFACQSAPSYQITSHPPPLCFLLFAPSFRF